MNRDPKTPIDWIQYWFEVILFSWAIATVGIVSIHVWRYYCGV